MTARTGAARPAAAALDVDRLRVQLQDQIELALMLDAVFTVCATVAGQQDRALLDGLWEGLRVVAGRMAEDLEQVQDALGAATNGGTR